MAYGNLTDWYAYALARGSTAPSDAEDVDAASALQRADDYIRINYVSRLKANVADTIPEIEEATYIAAGYELATVGFFSKAYTPDQQKVLVAVEGIKWKARDVEAGFGSAVPISTLIEALLDPFVVERGNDAIGAFVV